MSKILTIIAPQGYQDIEYEEPKKILKQKGHQVITASLTPTAYGSLGGKTKVDIILNEVKPEEYDAVVFVGGPGSTIYFDNKTALNLAKTFYESNKFTCAICAGPIILANAGLLKDKKATVYSGGSQDIISKGAKYTGKPTEIDGKIITGNGPMSAKFFGELIAKNLS